MATTKTVGAAGGALGIGAVAGFTLDPAKGLEVLKWLNEAIGAVGFVAILCLGAGLAISVTANWLFWNRLTAKDLECQGELSRQRTAWKSVVDSKEADNKEMAKTVANLLVQVTLMVERLSPTRTRSN